MNFIRVFIILLSFTYLFSACSDENFSYESRKQICILFSPSGLGDMGYNDCILQGVQDVRRDYEDVIDFRYYLPASLDEGNEILRNLLVDSTASSETLIVLAGSEYEPLMTNMNRVMLTSSQKEILLFETSNSYQTPIHSFKISIYGASYLAGVMASYMKTSPLVLQAYDNDKAVTDACDGFVNGFEVFGDTSKVNYVSLASDFSGYYLSEVAYEKMDEWARNYDFIFPVVGGTNMGIYRYLREYGNDVYTVGMDVDQSSYCPQIIGSVVKHINRLLKDILLRWISTGTLPTNTVYDLESGYIEWILSPKYIMVLNEKFKEYRNIAIQRENEYISKKDIK